MARYVDESVDGTPVGRCIVLPGRRYTADHPLLHFAAHAAMVRGWDVRQVWWEVPTFGGRADDAEEVAWVCDQLDAAVDGYAERVLVVAKSLGTLAAPLAAERGYPAAWLTPLLTEPDAAELLLSYPAEQFVLIGSEDPYLDQEVLDALPGERLVVPGDHVLQVPGDAVATVDSHRRFVLSFDGWLSRIRSGAAGV